MGVSQKNRRKIVVNDRVFFWQIRVATDGIDYAWSGDLEGWSLVLSVVSEDKHFNILYGITQQPEICYLTSIGQEFPKIAHSTSGYCRVRCPRWEGQITPAIVRQMIEWCFIPDEAAVIVTWQGKQWDGQVRFPPLQ